MEPAQLIAFNIAILGALASPGPAFLALMRSTLQGGRMAGILCGLGFATAACCWSLLAILGMTALFTVVPWAYLAMKLIGAAYLIWLALQLWRNADTPMTAVVPGAGRGFRFGLLVNLANPKAVFFIAAIFATIFPQMPHGRDAAILLGNHFLLETLWYALGALLFSTARVRAVYLRAKARIDRIAAAMLGCLAIRIVT